MSFKKNKTTLVWENTTLRRRIRYLIAKLEITKLERDAARTALCNYNQEQLFKELEMRYKK